MKRAAFFILFIFSLLQAISFLPGDGAEVLPKSREYHFHHHSGKNDYQFFGPSTWAVRFDFRSKYPTIAEVYFNTRGARLYFPNVGDSVTIQLYSDDEGSPGMLIDGGRTRISDHIVDYRFTQQYSADVVWLFVQYHTDILNRHISASAGGGNYSYFMQEHGEIQTLTNFAQNGFAAELLFGLVGDYVFPNDGLELKDISFEGDLSPDGMIYPKLKIYNHSGQFAQNPTLNLTLSHPSEANYETYFFDIREQITPRAEIDISMQDSRIRLPEDACQLRIEARINSSIAENDTLLLNNRKTVNLGIYRNEQPIWLIENFVRNQDIATIRYHQERHLLRKTHPVEYYPMLTDSLGNIASQRRFNGYRFNSLPRTMILGERQIAGLTAGYPDLFEDALQDLDAHKSFISRVQHSLQEAENAARMELRLSFENSNTDLFDTQAANPMLNSRIYAGLFNRVSIDSQEVYILKRWVAFADTLNNRLHRGTSAEKAYDFSTVGLDSEGHSRDYRIYYWIQQDGSGKIHYADYTDFRLRHAQHEEEPETPALSLSIYPNPGYGDGSFSCEIKAESGKLSIYNLRGQKLYAERYNAESFELPGAIFPTSGIYLIRYKDELGRIATKKISIIK